LNTQSYINEDTTDYTKRLNKRVSLSETQKRLLSILLQAKNSDRIGLTRTILVEILHLPRTTIYDNLIKMQKLKIIEKFIKNSGKRGRPLVFWRLK
jgi:Fe2+ or Zn2+ uptake regulation protein